MIALWHLNDEPEFLLYDMAYTAFWRDCSAPSGTSPTVSAPEISLNLFICTTNAATLLHTGTQVQNPLACDAARCLH